MSENIENRHESKIELDKEALKKIGLKSSDLPKVLSDILDIYSKICGGRKTSTPNEEMIESINNTLDRADVSDWRFGSNLKVNDKNDTDAKLIFRRIRYNFNNNHEKIDSEIRIYFDPNIAEGAEAESMKYEFDRAVAELLINMGLSIEV